MKGVMLTVISLISSLFVLAQTSDCDNQLDTAQVIKIAKRHNSYWMKDWFSPPLIKFDSQHCEWTVCSYKSKHINKGECKYTNGCMLTKSLTTIIDARTKKVKSRTKETKLFPNYE
jgi:hypothetical protein